MWIELALFAALGSSVEFTIGKRLASHFHPVSLLFFRLLFTLPFMLIIIFFMGGIPKLTPLFFAFIICSCILDLIAFLCSAWAVKMTPISLLSPLSSLTPIFATIAGVLFLHEIPTPLKFTGIITIVCGAYFLNISEVKGGILMPFKKLFSDKGVKLYALQTVIFGFTPIFQKQAIFQTQPVTPLFASLFSNFLITVFLSFFITGKLKEEKTILNKSIWWLLLFGVINALTQLAAFTVFSLTNVGYATALFSLSILITIFSGGVFFKEQKIKERLLGAVIMILGTILLAL